MKRKLLFVLVLFFLCNVAQAQSEVPTTRRTFWAGINGNFGVLDLEMGDDLLDGIYGVTLNTAISINNRFAVGPYFSYNIFNEDPAPFGGLIVKLTFPNNFAVFGGYGLGRIEQDYYSKFSLYNEFRVGYKFRRSFFITGSYWVGEHRGGTVGIGFSFGGKPKMR